MGKETQLVVDVEELQGRANDIASVCKGVDGAVEVLVQHLQTASKTGIKAGQASETFSAFTDEIARLKGCLEDSGTAIKKEILTFLDDIDEEDDLLFKNKGVKPFTDEEFRACFAVVENTTEPTLNGNSLMGFFSRLLDKFVKFIWRKAEIEVSVGDNESVLREKVQNLKEKTVKKITTIKNGVRSADRTHRQNLKNQLDVLKIYEQALRSIEKIVSTDTGIVDANTLKELSLFLDQYDLFASNPTVITDEDVKVFADNVSGYFDSSTTIISCVCVASVGNMVTSDFDRYRATITSARDYFNTYATEYTQSYEQFQKNKEEFDKMLELYNKYGADWVKHYGGDKDAAKLFNKIIKETGKLSKEADAYIDIWFQLFCDMSESKEAFLRFKNSCDLDNAGVQKALERLEDLYNNKLDAYMLDSLETFSQKIKKEVVEKVVEEVAEGVSEAVTSGDPIPSRALVMEKLMVEFASNLIEQAYAEAPAVAKYEYILATENAFNNAVADLKAANPGSAGYDELVLTVRQNFETAKQARIDFFETMAKSASKQEKAFYRLNIESLKTMSLDDVTAHKGITPGDYYGENSNVFGYVFDGDISVSY